MADTDSEVYKNQKAIELPLGVTPIPRKFIEPGVGYCPFPTQSELYSFIVSYSELVSQSVGIVHTLDRMNLQAIGEIVSEKNGLVSNSTWAQTVEANFVIEYWPFI